MTVLAHGHAYFKTPSNGHSCLFRQSLKSPVTSVHCDQMTYQDFIPDILQTNSSPKSPFQPQIRTMFSKRRKDLTALSSDDGEKGGESGVGSTTGDTVAEDTDEGYPGGVRLAMMLLALILAMLFVSMLSTLLLHNR